MRRAINVVDLGAGDGSKTEHLLRAALRLGKKGALRAGRYF